MLLVDVDPPRLYYTEPSTCSISTACSRTRGAVNWTIGHIVTRNEFTVRFFSQHNVSAMRRVRKSDNNNRIALAVGATVVNRVEVEREADVGTQCGLFHMVQTSE